MKKLIYCLPLLLIFIAYYKGQNKTPQKLSVPDGKVIESKTIPAEQLILNIPWIDPSLLSPTKGC